HVRYSWPTPSVMIQRVLSIHPTLFIQSPPSIQQTLYNGFHVDLHTAPRRHPPARTGPLRPHALPPPPCAAGRSQLSGRSGRSARADPAERLQPPCVPT